MPVSLEALPLGVFASNDMFVRSVRSTVCFPRRFALCVSLAPQYHAPILIDCPVDIQRLLCSMWPPSSKWEAWFIT